MSRYRGPRFKKIRRLGALLGLTSKRTRSGSDLKNPLRFGKRSQYRIRLEENQKLRFHYGLTESFPNGMLPESVYILYNKDLILDYISRKIRREIEHIF